MSSKYCRHVSTQKPLATELTKRIRFCASSQILSTATPVSVGKVKLFLVIILFNAGIWGTKTQRFTLHYHRKSVFVYIAHAAYLKARLACDSWVQIKVKCAQWMVGKLVKMTLGFNCVYWWERAKKQTKQWYHVNIDALEFAAWRVKT